MSNFCFCRISKQASDYKDAKLEREEKRKVDKKPKEPSKQVAILEMVYINNELYFLVLFTDNVVEFVHYRAMQHLSHDLYRSFFNPRRNSIS